MKLIIDHLPPLPSCILIVLLIVTDSIYHYCINNNNKLMMLLINYIIITCLCKRGESSPSLILEASESGWFFFLFFSMCFSEPQLSQYVLFVANFLLLKMLAHQCLWTTLWTDPSFPIRYHLSKLLYLRVEANQCCYYSLRYYYHWVVVCLLEDRQYF